MFPTSSQRKYWTFEDESEIFHLQEKANESYIRGYDDSKSKVSFLAVSEEIVLKHYYTSVLKEFGLRFKPEMPRSVIALAMNYMKRFYLYNSVMDYHPKDIMLTCAFHACKVDEFNVTLKQFVSNIRGDRPKLADCILSFEHLLMGELKFHLTIHLPYRPMEGLLIYFKTYYPDENGERLRDSAIQFIELSLETNASLLFAPSQIALAALQFSASKLGIDLITFIRQQISENNELVATKTLEQIEKISATVDNAKSLNRAAVKAIESKLALCRNPENDPKSDAYRRKMEELQELEDQKALGKFNKTSERQREAECKYLDV